ncbi:cupredoxin domain-containing protein [Blastococcus montanus]|uniref:cupredoxin domain-containing protein n=1 Tax=Blastococcus montanus TaxID=3144973 RepID=UPI0032097439
MSRLLRTPGASRRAAAALLFAGTLAAVSACGGGTDPGTNGAAPTATEEPTTEAPATRAPSTGSPSAAPTDSERAVRTISATEEEFSISVDERSVPAGSYEIEVVNAGSASHDLVVERDGEDVAATEILSPGDSATLTVDLEPGEYVFYCSVGTHRSLGMEITIEVT